MSRTTLAVWAVVLAAGAFALLSAYFRSRRYPQLTLSPRQRALRWTISGTWVVAAIATPTLGHDGPQRLLTGAIAVVVVACVSVGLVDFLD